MRDSPILREENNPSPRLRHTLSPTNPKERAVIYCGPTVNPNVEPPGADRRVGLRLGQATALQAYRVAAFNDDRYAIIATSQGD